MDLSSFSIGNAAGRVNRPGSDYDDLMRSAATEVTLGSLCLLRRHGNLGDTYWFDQETRTSWNSKGLPSPPIEETLAFLPCMKVQAESAKKTLVANFAGFSPTENATLLERLAPYSHVQEWNGGCGNVWGTEGQKPIPVYLPELFAANLAELARVARTRSVRCRVKVGVYDLDNPDEEKLLTEIAWSIARAGFVNEIVVGNTRINQDPKRTDGAHALNFREAEGGEVRHVGGMGGRGVKSYTLPAVKAFRSLLPKDTRIVACGGIFEGSDLIEYAEAGATGFQIGTAYFESTPKIFSEVLQQAGELLG